MKFEWIEEGDGRYRVQFFDMDEKKVFDIKITDYSDPYWQQSDLERKIRRECCYDVIFYAGYGVAMECQGFINGFSIALDMLK